MQQWAFPAGSVWQWKPCIALLPPVLCLISLAAMCSKEFQQEVCSCPSLNCCTTQRCQSGPGSICYRHPAGFAGEELVRATFPLLCLLVRYTKQAGAGKQSVTLSLQLIVSSNSKGWALGEVEKSSSEVFCLCSVLHE